MPRAVILTALPIEYQAVTTHLTNLQEEMHPQGTIYERGKFVANSQEWEVGIAEVGAGNTDSAVEAERAIAYFEPEILFFVGIAGGIKDVAIGDVVAATKMYSYESGKVQEQQFATRPTLGQSAYALVQRAKAEARKQDWLKRLTDSSSSKPRVFVAPIAAGEKVVASRQSDIFQFLRASYNDAIAVEMEGFGFLSAAFAYPNIKAIVIRGISDLVEGKNDDDLEPEEIRQKKASHHASAFAFEILAKLQVFSISDPQSKKSVLLKDAPEVIPKPHASVSPSALEMPEGTMDSESFFYVERQADAIALSTIQRQGVTITIKGPRQIGKSSLLIRLMNKAVEAGKHIAFLDFQLFDRVTLTDAEQFFRQFCSWLSDELELENRVEEYWSQKQSNSLCCTRYMQRHLLKQLGCPLVLAMDEVESVFDTPFRSDFFSMLRSWHNSRAMPSMPIWKKLDLALVTSTEPYQLIENLNQSPFNVGQVIELVDFTQTQITDLNQRHGLPFNPSQEEQLMSLVSGQPYLVRRALYLVASQQMTAVDLFATARNDRGPFGDHLRYHLFRMQDNKELVRGFLQVLKRNICQDEGIFFRLHGAGLVRREGQTVLPRCQLYADYFQEHLYG